MGRPRLSGGLFSRRLDGGLAPADGDRARDRTGASAQRVTVVAGFDDPLAVFLSDDLADVMRPDDDGADARRSGSAPMRPVAREVIRRPRVAADEAPHLPATPCSRTSAVAVHGMMSGMIIDLSGRTRLKSSRRRFALTARNAISHRCDVARHDGYGDNNALARERMVRTSSRPQQRPQKPSTSLR